MTEATNPKFETVMIIDDNNIDLYVITRLLKNYNFATNIISFTNAEKALNYLIENQSFKSALPQVIFVDIFMPIMSGFEFIEAYENLPLLIKSNCRVFFISSTIDKNEINRVQVNKNIKAFHSKPLTKLFFKSITPLIQHPEQSLRKVMEK
jgi:CheY-like chemotaxis protein